MPSPGSTSPRRTISGPPAATRARGSSAAWNRSTSFWNKSWSWRRRGGSLTTSRSTARRSLTIVLPSGPISLGRSQTDSGGRSRGRPARISSSRTAGRKPTISSQVFGLQVLDQRQMTDQFVHDRTDVIPGRSPRSGRATRPAGSALRLPGARRGSDPPGGLSASGRPTRAIDGASRSVRGLPRPGSYPRSRPCGGCRENATMSRPPINA